MNSILVNLKISLIILFCFLSFELLASPQRPDFIIYNGDTIATYNLLLEFYLEKLDTVEANKLFGLSFRDGATTNCWRGYQAVYKIENDKLFLVAIINCGGLKNKPFDNEASLKRMKSIFKELVKNDKVLIDWYTGIINLPLNNKVLRWDGVFYTIFEQETLLNIDHGTVTGVQSVNNYEDNPKAIDRRYNDKISTTMFNRLKRIKWKKADDCDCSEKYLITIDDSGTVSKVRMVEYDTEEKIGKEWDMWEYDYCIKRMLKGLRDLRFDIIKDKGKPISEDVYLEIFTTDKGRIENWTN